MCECRALQDALSFMQMRKLARDMSLYGQEKAELRLSHRDLRSNVASAREALYSFVSVWNAWPCECFIHILVHFFDYWQLLRVDQPKHNARTSWIFLARERQGAMPSHKNSMKDKEFRRAHSPAFLNQLVSVALREDWQSWGHDQRKNPQSLRMSVKVYLSIFMFEVR